MSRKMVFVQACSIGVHVDEQRHGSIDTDNLHSWCLLIISERFQNVRDRCMESIVMYANFSSQNHSAIGYLSFFCWLSFTY